MRAPFIGLGCDSADFEVNENTLPPAAAAPLAPATPAPTAPPVPNPTTALPAAPEVPVVPAPPVAPQDQERQKPTITLTPTQEKTSSLIDRLRKIN